MVSCKANTKSLFIDQACSFKTAGEWRLPSNFYCVFMDVTYIHLTLAGLVNKSGLHSKSNLFSPRQTKKALQGSRIFG